MPKNLNLKGAAAEPIPCSMPKQTAAKKGRQASAEPTASAGGPSPANGQQELGRWAPDGNLAEHIVSLLQEALGLRHPLFEEKTIIKSLYPNYRELLHALDIDPTDFNRWSNGNDKRAVNPTTHRLRGLISGETSIDRVRYPHKRDENGTLAECLLAFWQQEKADKLGDVRVLLDAHQEKIARLEAKDEAAKYEARRAALAAAAAAARQEGTSQDFVIDPTPETLPPALRPPQRRQIVYRDAIVTRLKTLFSERAREGILITLAGPPRAGKSAVLQKLALELSTPENGNKPSLAMLHVALRRVSRPLRALYLAVSGPAGLRRSGILPAGVEEEGEAELLDAEAEFIQTHIPHKVGTRGLIVFVEGFAELAGTDAELRELDQIFRSAPFRYGFTLMESIGVGVSVPAPSLTSIPVSLLPFSPDQAIEFLGEHLQLADCAREAVGHLNENLLHPGILLDGATRFHPMVIAAGDQAATAEDVALAIMERASDLAGDIVIKLSAGECDPHAAMQSLMAMAVFAEAPINQALLDRANLAPIPRERLVKLGWLEAPRGEMLVGFGLDALRAAAALTLTERSPSRQGSGELRAAIERLAVDLFRERDDRMSAVLEETVAWLGRHAPRYTELPLRLKALLIQESFVDAVSPFTEDDDRTLASEFYRQGVDNANLDFALASLAEYAREQFGQSGRSREMVCGDFLKSLDSTATLIRTAPELSSRQLFALDNAIYIGSRRFHLFERTLEVRKAISLVLAEREETALEERNSPWISGWLSFLMNTADLSLSAGDRDAALGSSQNVERIVEVVGWLSDGSWKEWLLARLSLLRARLAPDISEQKDELAEATEHAGLCVAYAPDNPKCVRFYLRTVLRLVDADGDESARRQHVDDAKLHLETILGSCNEWDVSTRAQFAALMRQEARRAWDTEYRGGRAREALALLNTGKDGTQEIDADPQALLVKARIQAFLGEADAALVSCDKALKIAPSPAAWHLKLRLLDSEGTQQEWADDDDLSHSQLSPLSPRLRQALKEFRNWSWGDSEGNRSYGKVVLWTTKREWQSQGSLERHVSVALQRQNIDYAGLTKTDKLRRLRAESRNRSQKLAGIKKRFYNSEDSIDLIGAELENAKQLVRSESVLSGTSPETAVPLGVIDKGLERFPGSHILRFWRAEYLRYIWDIDSAIADFRELRTIPTDGELRRQASFCLAKCLHSAMVHRDDASEEQLVTWAKEAKDLLMQLSGAFREAEEIAILKDHVALESGEQVDWVSLEEMYNKIVGLIDGFPSTLIRNYDLMRTNKTVAPINIAEVLQQNFASPECLGFAGLLYLRRAEKKLGNRQQEDFACAVAFLRAQALIERSWSGQEYPVTSFRIGRAILSAAKNFLSLNPIEGLDTGGRVDQLALAEAKFNSASSRAAGEFRSMARLCQGQVVQLRAQLRG